MKDNSKVLVRLLAADHELKGFLSRIHLKEQFDVEWSSDESQEKSKPNDALKNIFELKERVERFQRLVKQPEAGPNCNQIL
jgi:hypothetical protein